MINRLQKVYELEMPYIIMDLVYRRIINLILFNNIDFNFKDNKRIIDQIISKQNNTKLHANNFQFKFSDHKKIKNLFENRNKDNQIQIKISKTLD